MRTVARTLALVLLLAGAARADVTPAAVEAAKAELAKARGSIAKAEKLLTPPAHARCGWVGANDAAGYAAFAANAAYYDAIHPVWFAINPDGLSVRTLSGAKQEPAVRAAAVAAGVQLWPTVAGVRRAGQEGQAVGDDVVIRGMMADPMKRLAHIRVLVSLVVVGQFTGLDVDYEHLNQPGDQVLYTKFANELSAALHAAGKQASFCVRGLQRPVANQWASYKDLTDGPADVLHIMGYDYHTADTHPGPVSPLGWIAKVADQAAATGKPGRFVLGLPNYSSRGIAPLGAHAMTAGAGYPTASDHMKSCPFNEGVDPAGREPRYRDGSVFFDDTASLEEKVKAAKARGLGGICLWTIAGEPAGFFEMVRRSYP